jgi:hypothetical protein
LEVLFADSFQAARAVFENLNEEEFLKKVQLNFKFPVGTEVNIWTKKAYY